MVPGHHETTLLAKFNPFTAITGKPGFDFPLHNLINGFSGILTAWVWTIGNWSQSVRGGSYTVYWILIQTPPFHVLSWTATHTKFASKRTEKILVCYRSPFLQPWLYYREHLKYVWNVYCVVANHMLDPHTTGNEPFPIGHGTNYFLFV